MTHPCSALKQLIFLRLSVSVFFALILLSPVAYGDQLKPKNEISPEPLHLGLLPYLSSDALMRTWNPLIHFLERYLKRQVIATTAPDFKTYIKRISEGRYDVYFTAPHIAAYAEKQHKHKRLMRLSGNLNGVVVVTAESSYKDIESLRGKIIATPDRLALITLLGELLLSDNGLAPHKDVILKYAPNHNTAIMFVTKGHADAAIVSSRIFALTKPEVKKKLRLLTHTRKMPHAMFMARPGHKEQEYLKFKEALMAFSSDEIGKAFFRGRGFNVSPITDNDMKQLSPTLLMLENRL